MIMFLSCTYIFCFNLFSAYNYLLLKFFCDCFNISVGLQNNVVKHIGNKKFCQITEYILRCQIIIEVIFYPKV